ncbi:hypothetical protein CEXT_170901 [Caerostris extrusa]|uniref:Uncharacterized protein n=1 Tax=Caerostris extrusa TaxID=172846 RepID=A0AAV4XSX0_CAEEX|nr:hypothetical protein CEXT_170901 [Caerostris extrusa]
MGPTFALMEMAVDYERQPICHIYFVQIGHLSALDELYLLSLNNSTTDEKKRAEHIADCLQSHFTENDIPCTSTNLFVDDSQLGDDDSSLDDSWLGSH